MLAYKKKSLEFNKSDFTVPTYLQSEIEKENEHILILRDYQRQQNDTDRQVKAEKESTGTALAYLPGFFIVDGSYLSPSNYEEIGDLYRTFSFHYDMSVNDLYERTREKFAQCKFAKHSTSK